MSDITSFYKISKISATFFIKPARKRVFETLSLFLQRIRYTVCLGLFPRDLSSVGGALFVRAWSFLWAHASGGRSVRGNAGPRANINPPLNTISSTEVFYYYLASIYFTKRISFSKRKWSSIYLFIICFIYPCFKLLT